MAKLFKEKVLFRFRKISAESKIDTNFYAYFVLTTSCFDKRNRRLFI